MTWMYGLLIPNQFVWKRIRESSCLSLRDMCCPVYFQHRVFLFIKVDKILIFVSLYVTCSFILDIQRRFVFL